MTHSFGAKQHGNSSAADESPDGVATPAGVAVSNPAETSVLPRHADQPPYRHIHMWQGPFPPPEAVREYERVLPGSWDRLLTMAETAQAAQIQTTHNAQEFMRRDTKRGHILGVVAMLAAMGGAVYCVHADHAGVAVAFLSVTVMAVARALVETARSQHTGGQDPPRRDSIPGTGQPQ